MLKQISKALKSNSEKYLLHLAVAILLVVILGLAWWGWSVSGMALLEFGLGTC